MKTTQLEQIRQKNTVKKGALWGLMCVLAVSVGVLALPRIEDSAFVSTPVKNVISQMFPTASTTAISDFKTSPKPTPGVGFSVGQSLLGLPSDERNKRLDDMASLGATWLRFDIEWSDVQPKDSHTYDWSRIDALVHAASARHLSILPILVYAPRWARSDVCIDSVRCAPKDPGQFAAFAAAAATRYAPLGVHQWEIWNEPNLAASWLPKADAAEYTAFLKASYISIKKVDPAAVVVTGGLGPSATRDNNLAPTDFLSAIYDVGAKSSFDAVGFHPYSFPVNPGFPQSWNAWQQMTDTNPSLRSVMIKNGDGDKKIWITEYGAPTGGPGGMSEYAQTSMLTDAVKLWQSYSFVGPLMLYTYKDMGTDQSTKENFFGLVRYDGTLKPAYTALKHLISTL